MILRKVIKIVQSYELVVNDKVFHGKTSNSCRSKKTCWVIYLRPMHFSGLTHSPWFSSSYFMIQYPYVLRKSLQKKLFLSIYKLFLIVRAEQYKIFVSNILFGRLSFITYIVYNMNSANYALNLGDRPFPILLF